MRDADAHSIIPGPKPSALLGWRSNLRALGRDPLVYLQGLQQRYGALAAVTQGQEPVVAVFDPDLVERLRQQPALFVPAMSPVVPVTLPTPQHFQACYEHTLHHTQRLLDRWGGGQLVDIVYVARRIVLSGVLAAFFGVDVSADETQPTGEIIRRWLHNTLALPQRVFPSSLVGRASVRRPNAYAELHAMFTTLIAASPQGMLPRQAFAPDDAADGRLALVALLHEATSLAVGWTTLLLSQHAGVLHDLAEELQRVLGAQPPSVDDLLAGDGRLPMLDGVVKESLRLLPPVGVGACVSTAAWSYAGLRFPSNTTLLYSPYVLQREQQFYYAPDRFRPQRWPQIEPPAVAFMPLGAGPLAELALPLVLLQTKLVVAVLFQRYAFSPAPGTQVDRARSFLVAPQHDIPFIIAPLDRTAPRRGIQGTIRDLVSFL